MIKSVKTVIFVAIIQFHSFHCMFTFNWASKSIAYTSKCNYHNYNCPDAYAVATYYSV